MKKSYVSVALGLSFSIMGAAPAWCAISACRGVPNSTVIKAQSSAKAQACTDAAAIASGTHASKAILTSDGKTILSNLITQFNLPPFCAGSIAAVMAQQLADGKLSAGSCPAP
jgi:hypothetical protein